MQKKTQYIAIAGNIGSGKTTLTEFLSEDLGWDKCYEDMDKNPYINDFYDDMRRWSFQLQVFFLKERYKTILDIESNGLNTVLDRTIYEDAHIFASNLHEMGLLSSRDFETYIELYRSISTNIPKPSLIIYLKGSVSVLVDHIQTRGREYEGNISMNYLKRLSQKYENWIKSVKGIPVYTLDIDKYDFKQNPEDRAMIVAKVKEMISL